MQSKLSKAQALKKLWTEKITELQQSYREGLGGNALTQKLTEQMDSLVGLAYKNAIREVLGSAQAPVPSLVLMALGGFGRRQLCPYSDVDLMFLYRPSRNTQNEQIIKATFHQLWDMGLEIGHAARSPSEAMALAQHDSTSLTSMLESRFLEGDLQMYQGFQQGLITYVQKKRKSSFIKEKTEERVQRIKKFGESVCVQEPHLKEGLGALRDLHYALWLVQLLTGVKDIEGAHSRRLICRLEAEKLKAAVDYILRLRHGLHFLCGRREDHLTFARQESLAKSLGFVDQLPELAEATMLRQYFSHATTLYRFAETMTQRALGQIESRSFFSKPWQFLEGTASPPKDLGPLFVIRRGEIAFREFQSQPEKLREYFAEDRFRIIEMTEHLQDYGVQWSPPVCLSLEASQDLIDDEFIQKPVVGRRLLQLFQKPFGLGKALQGLRDTGLLSKFFPELRTMRFLVRHDFYHRYTVDEHSIRCFDVLDKLSSLQPGSETADRFSEEALASVWRRVRRPELVRLGALFHDAGKGTDEDHSQRGARLVEPVLKRLGLAQEEGEIVQFLIRDHLVMAETAFRRDLDDYKTVGEFALRVGTLAKLNKLLVLTYIDISSVSPGMMTPWKAGLLWQLYLKTRQVLLGERSFVSQDVRQCRENILSVLSGHFPEDFVNSHLDQMPPQYALYASPGLVSRHLAALKDYDGTSVQVRMRFLDWHEIEAEDGKKGPEDTLEVIICTKDRLGLFRDLARCFHLENFHIISARLFTRKDGTVMDTILAVNALPNTAVGLGRQQLLKERLQKALAPDMPPPVFGLCPLPEPKEISAADMGRSSFQTEIEFLNDVSADYSLIEVEAVDQPALLETVAACLTEKGLNIRFARMQKLGIRVVQAFYVTNREGHKISNDQFQSEIQSFVLRYVDPRVLIESE